MAIDKNKSLPMRDLPMDAAVEAAMTGDPDDPIYGKLLDRRRKARNMTEYQRRKMERDAARVKLTIEISPELKHRLDTIRESAEVPPTDLVSLLLHLGMQGIENGQINLDDYKYNSNLPRYPFRLLWKTDNEVESE